MGDTSVSQARGSFSGLLKRRLSVSHRDTPVLETEASGFGYRYTVCFFAFTMAGSVQHYIQGLSSLTDWRIMVVQQRLGIPKDRDGTYSIAYSNWCRDSIPETCKAGLIAII